MCDTVLINGLTCDCAGELAAQMGVPVSALAKRHLNDMAILPEACLCQIDLQTTALQHGFVMSVYFDAVSDWKFERARIN